MDAARLASALAILRAPTFLRGFFDNFPVFYACANQPQRLPGPISAPHWIEFVFHGSQSFPFPEPRYPRPHLAVPRRVLLAGGVGGREIVRY